MVNQIDCDATEFGSHFRQGGWRLGLLVARNCEPKQGQRNLATSGEVTSPQVAKSNKLSCEQFAAKAGVSASTVKYYYAAWESAAEAGYCLSAKELNPGQDDLEDFDEDDYERREIWSKFYQKAREPKKPKQQVEKKQTKEKTETKQEVKETESSSETITLDEAELDAQFRHERIVNAREALEAHHNKLDELSVITTAEDVAAVEEIMRIAEAILNKCKELTQLKSED